MKKRPGKGTIAAVIGAVLLTAAAAMVLSGGRSGWVRMSAEEYEEYRSFIALDEVADKIEENFYAEVPSRDTLVAGAAAGMLDTLDDKYAAYYTAEEYKEYLESVNGEYRGVGMLVTEPGDKGSEVVEVYEGSPAEAAGIRKGDIITHIAGMATSDMTMEDISMNIALYGEEGVVLGLLRGEEAMEVKVYSGDVTVKHVEHRMLGKNTGYIQISMFSGNCADEFDAAMEELTDGGMTSLVIDLRGNPGGNLNAVVDIADRLLGRGMRIVSVGPEDGEDEEVYEAKGRQINLPIAVLVNENSASASEILAAAVQENGIGKIVGTKTYGKGIVQTTMQVESTGGWLKLTTDAYYTPLGNNIHGVGITPDIPVELTEGKQGTEEDEQLSAALEYVRAEAG